MNTHKIHIAYRSFRLYIYGLLLSAIGVTLSFICFFFFNVYIFWTLRIPKNKLLSLQLQVGPTKSELPGKKQQYFKSIIQAWVLLLISPSQWLCN